MSAGGLIIRRVPIKNGKATGRGRPIVLTHLSRTLPPISLAPGFNRVSPRAKRLSPTVSTVFLRPPAVANISVLGLISFSLAGGSICHRADRVAPATQLESYGLAGCQQLGC